MDISHSKNMLRLKAPEQLLNAPWIVPKSRMNLNLKCPSDTYIFLQARHFSSITANLIHLHCE